MSNVRMENGSIKGGVVSKKHIEKVKNTLSGIIDCYMKFLCKIANKYSIYSKSKEANERLFDNVKTELFNFVFQHMDFVSTNQYVVKLNEKALSKFSLRCLYSADKFIDFQEFFQFCQGIILYKNDRLVKCVADIEFKEAGLALLLERLFQKPLAEITETNLVEFDKITVMNDKTWQLKKCSYAELKSKITRRIYDFKKNIVSIDRLEELTFVYDETTKHLVSNKECSICQTTYENGEKVSRMPCNHCFHRHCIEQWFKPPSAQNSKSRSRNQSMSDSSSSSVSSLSSLSSMSSVGSTLDLNDDIELGSLGSFNENDSARHTPDLDDRNIVESVNGIFSSSSSSSSMSSLSMNSSDISITSWSSSSDNSLSSSSSESSCSSSVSSLTSVSTMSSFFSDSEDENDTNSSPQLPNYSCNSDVFNTPTQLLVPTDTGVSETPSSVLRHEPMSSVPNVRSRNEDISKLCRTNERSLSRSQEANNSDHTRSQQTNSSDRTRSTRSRESRASTVVYSVSSLSEFPNGVISEARQTVLPLPNVLSDSNPSRRTTVNEACMNVTSLLPPRLSPLSNTLNDSTGVRKRTSTIRPPALTSNGRSAAFSRRTTTGRISRVLASQTPPTDPTSSDTSTDGRSTSTEIFRRPISASTRRFSNVHAPSRRRTFAEAFGRRRTTSRFSDLQSAPARFPSNDDLPDDDLEFARQHLSLSEVLRELVENSSGRKGSKQTCPNCRNKCC